MASNGDQRNEEWRSLSGEEIYDNGEPVIFNKDTADFPILEAIQMILTAMCMVVFPDSIRHP